MKVDIRDALAWLAIVAVVVYAVWGAQRLTRLTAECEAAGGHPVSRGQGWDVLCLRPDAVVKTKP